MWGWFILAFLVGYLVILWSAFILARGAATYSPNDGEEEET